MYLSSVHNQVRRLKPLHVLLILTILGFLAYANAVRHPFVHDDVVFIAQNPHLADLSLKSIFFPASEAGDEFLIINKYYRPLLELINRLLYRIVGRNPYGFHFFNVLLHIANSFLIYAIARFILGRKGLSLAASVLFLLHPVQNEAVACISGISNLVFTFLCLMSFYAYLESVHGARGENSQLLYGTSLILFLFALLAKEQSVILPVLIMAYELCFTKAYFKSTVKKCWRYIGGFFLVLAVYFSLRKILFGYALLRPADHQGELWIRLLAVPRSLLTYLSLIFFPHDLHYYRSQDVLLPFLGPLLAVMLIIPVFAFVVFRTPKPQKSWMLFGLAWFMISLAPTLNIIPLINEYSLILTAEHFLYFPLAGMILFAVGAVHYWIGQRVPRMVPAALTIFLIMSAVFIAMNIRQNTFWRGEIPLFERTLLFENNFGRARFLLAKAYAAAGRYEDAAREGRKALAIMQGYEERAEKKTKAFYTEYIKRIHYHLGYCLDSLGDHQEALSEFKSALRSGPENALIHYNVGLSYLKNGKVKDAIVHFEKSLELSGGDLMVMNTLALCYENDGRHKEAERLLRTIVEKDSGSVSAKQNLENFLKKKQTEP